MYFGTLVSVPGEELQADLDLSVSDAIAWIAQRVAEREPTAAVRFGDGEAKLLVADPDDRESLNIAVGKIAKESGRRCSPEEALEVKAVLAFAFEKAEMLGIRYQEIWSAETKRWMGRLPALHEKNRKAGRPPAILVSNLNWSTLPEMLAGRRVSVVSCRDVKPVLEGKWGLRDVAVYQVPSQYMVRDVNGEYEAALHDVPIWPDGHSRVAAELTVRERGEVFLVGAGVFGKDLCVRVRDQGGIALDVGSELDRLAGKITRGVERRVLDLHRGGMTKDEIASDLRRAYGVPVDLDDVSRFLATALDAVAE